MSLPRSLVIFFIISSVFCYDFKNLHIAHNGIAFPKNLLAIHGHDLRIQLLKWIPNQENCILKLPDFTTYDLKMKNSNNKFDSWGDKCGVKIKNVSKSDEGIWRLISRNKDDILEGVFSVNVKDLKKDIVEELDVTIFNDTQPTTLKLSNMDTSYCYLSQKGTSETVMVMGKCLLELDKVTKGHEGIWNVNFGIPGLLEEEKDRSHINVHVEEVIVGHKINKDNNSAQLYCNLRGSGRHLKFCRFERMADEKGFNLVDGLGKSRYSYHGRGLIHNECGLSIENIEGEDYGNWKCTLGFINGEELPLILNRVMILRKPSSRLLKTPITQIIGIEGKELKIKCSAGETISYCAATHPNGTEFPPLISKNGVQSPDAEYWYSPNNLDVGECEMTLKKATLADSGIWVCNMGKQYSPGVELIDQINVRVGGELSSVQPIIPVKIGKPATLHCISAGGNYPLKYCRFISSIVAFNIDNSITSDDPLLGKYYYPDDASLARGDCKVTIKTVHAEHLGKWTCAAMIDDTEYNDIILLQLDGADNLSTASVAGIVIGLIVLLVVLSVIGLMAWKRGTFGPSRLQESRSTSARPTVEIPTVHYTGRTSGESDTSETQFAVTGQHSTTYSPTGSGI